MFKKNTMRKITFFFFPLQGLSSSRLGGLFSYPYRYMAAPFVPNVPALNTCSSASSLPRSHFVCRPQPWLRFNPYLIPTSITFRQHMRAARLPNRPNPLSESRESGPVSENHKAKWRTASPKNN